MDSVVHAVISRRAHNTARPSKLCHDSRMETTLTSRDPGDLYSLADRLPERAPGGGPVMLHVLSGFIDAGNAVSLVREHLLGTLEHEVVATFDVDLLLDYRSRRPSMLFVENHWESYDDPSLALHICKDTEGTPFLLLAGPEPDLYWERFVTAVRGLVERLGVRLTVGMAAIPMAVPHTRPVGVTAHATRADLVAGYQPWVNTVQVPASVGNLLEYRLGRLGHDAMGFAVHVPHYVAQVDFPAASAVLLDAVAGASGLTLPSGPLNEAAERTRAEIDTEVDKAQEVREVVEALEGQYDAYLAARAGGNLLDGEGGDLPTADELGAELERFLAQQARRRDDQDG